jgi:hypothetical protein
MLDRRSDRRPLHEYLAHRFSDGHPSGHEWIGLAPDPLVIADG